MDASVEVQQELKGMVSFSVFHIISRNDIIQCSAVKPLLPRPGVCIGILCD
jgi:hypothetical protein